MSDKQLLQDTIKAVGKLDKSAQEKAHKRLTQLTMPHWALGRLLDLAEQLSAISGQVPPPVNRRALVIFAADHGVATEGVSLYPQEVTAQMIANFTRGGAASNALAKVGNAQLYVADLGCVADLSHLVHKGLVRNCKVAKGTANITQGPAMTRDQVLAALAHGIRIAMELAPQNDILAAGEKGIANTTPAAAILSVLGGIDPKNATGRGTGIDDTKWQHKVNVVRRAIEINNANPHDPLDVLAKVGGLEIAAITGFYLAAAASRKPIVVDGFICSASALVAQAMCPNVTSYMVAAHRSAEPGHQYMLRLLNLNPLLDLQFRLGEGTGAAMSFPLFDGARAMLCDVSTFEEAGVSGPKV